MAAYLELEEAQALAATLPGLTRFLAAEDDAATALLLLATADVDAAGPWQGRKYDPTPGAQALEFPRVAHGGLLPVGILGLLPIVPNLLSQETEIWDWDPTGGDDETGAAVVPPQVKWAVLYQCEWLLQPVYAKRLEQIKSGLSQQAIGTASETLLAGATGDGLCERSARLLAKYRLATGRLL